MERKNKLVGEKMCIFSRTWQRFLGSEYKSIERWRRNLEVKIEISIELLSSGKNTGSDEGKTVPSWMDLCLAFLRLYLALTKTCDMFFMQRKIQYSLSLRQETETVLTAKGSSCDGT